MCSNQSLHYTLFYIKVSLTNRHLSQTSYKSKELMIIIIYIDNCAVNIDVRIQWNTSECCIFLPMGWYENWIWISPSIWTAPGLNMHTTWGVLNEHCDHSKRLQKHFFQFEGPTSHIYRFVAPVPCTVWWQFTVWLLFISKCRQTWKNRLPWTLETKETLNGIEFDSLNKTSVLPFYKIGHTSNY